MAKKPRRELIANAQWNSSLLSKPERMDRRNDECLPSSFRRENCFGGTMKMLVGMMVLTTVLAASQVCNAQCSQPTQGAKSVLTIAAYPVRGRVKLGSSVLLKVSMTNKSRHDVSVWINNGGGEDQYQVDVRDEKRNLPAATQFGERRNGHVHLEMLKLQDLIASGTCVTLKRKESIMQQLNVTKLYEFSTPGKYFIRLQTADPETIAMVKSNTVRVTVTP